MFTPLTPRPRRRALLAKAMLAFLPAALAGCNTPGGSAWSLDRYTYESTPWQPWTVSLIDTRTQETIWTAEVPPGQQVVIAFRRGRGDTEAYPDLMTWGIVPAGRMFGAQSNDLPVPPASARLLKPTLRPAPEFPQARASVPPPPPMPPVEQPPAEAADQADEQPAQGEPAAEPPPPSDPG